LNFESFGCLIQAELFHKDPVTAAPPQKENIEIDRTTVSLFTTHKLIDIFF
jgi:hypothetical protein